MQFWSISFIGFVLHDVCIYFYIDAIVQRAANHLQENYIKSRFYYPPNDWPPYHPKHYTTLALIHHKGRVKSKIFSIQQELVTEGNLSQIQPSSSNKNHYIKDISELFPAKLSSFFLLIEGAPGIGKTVLSKEIAYQWADKELLKCKVLLLLFFLRDPNVTQSSSLKSLLHYSFQNDKIASILSEYLSQTNGKGVIIVFDGYDEMYKEDRNDSLVAKIIRRNVLPECDLVITSRPSASLYLRDMADCRVEVLGFTEEDRLDYIQHALENSNKKIEDLQHYLQANSTINALCYVPLNMTILLCLFEEGEHLSHDPSNKGDIGLPKTQTEMYEKFILMTITHFIKKANESFSCKYLEISKLPEPYNNILGELLHLAYNALKNDKIVFDLQDKFVRSCQVLKSGNLEGLGLLKVTEYASTTSFHFLHFSIQEYLAAYYISLQPDDYQLQLLKDTFWDNRYFNTWIMYVGITGGEKLAWKHFISGNIFMFFTKLFKSSNISRRFLNDKIKSLHLFQCFAEIEGKDLEKVFKDKTIDLSNQTLLPKDINIICFFLLRYGKRNWIKLDLCKCNIGNTGSDILCNAFMDNGREIVSIDKVDLSYNQLHGNSLLKLLDTFKVWQTSEAVVGGSYENDTNLFELCLNKFSLYDDMDVSQVVLIGTYIFAHNIDIQSQLLDSKNITGLYLNHCNYPSTYAKSRCKFELSISKLHIIGERINRYFIEGIVQTIRELVSVYIYDHTLSDKDVDHFTWMCRNILSSSGVWVIIGQTRILGSIPDMLTLYKLLSSIEIFNLTESIEVLCSNSSMSTAKFNKRCKGKSLFEHFFNLLHSVYIYKCDIDFCLVENNVLIANKIKYDEMRKVLSCNTKLVSIFIRKCKLTMTELNKIADLIGKQELLEKLYIFDSSLEIHNFNHEKLLDQFTLSFKELFIHTTDSSYTFDLHTIYRDFSNISVVLVTNDTLIGLNPTSEQILLSMKLEENLKIWKLFNFHASIELSQQMTDTLSNVMELHFLGWSPEEHKLQQCENHKKHNNYGNSLRNIKSISKIFSCFTKLKELNLCYNDLGEVDFGSIFKNITTSNLNIVKISNNVVNEKAVDDIVEFLSHACNLEELDLSCNNLQVSQLLKAIKVTSGFKSLNISNTGLNDAAAYTIAVFLTQNAQLKELDLSCNNLQTQHATLVCKGMKSLLGLIKLSVSNNNIGGDATNDIAVVLSQNKSLEELNLNNNNLEKIDLLRIFANMKNLFNLTKINISNIGITIEMTYNLSSVLDNNVNLKELDLSHNDVQAIGATIIFKASAVNLQKFNISHNNITDDVGHVEGFLSRNTKLEELNFSHNNLQDAGVKKICGADIFELTKFNISYNNVPFETAEDIAYFLSHNKKLKMLDLSGNDLQALGCKTIFKNVQNLPDLLVLKIGHSIIINHCGVADELAAFLFHCTSLQELDLSHSNLSASDVEKIFYGMKNISSLKAINISHNIISDQAADIIATFLSHSKLKSLDLSSNHFRSEGFVKICESLKNHICLRKLNISCNEINPVTAHGIATLLSQKSSIEELDVSDSFMQTESAIIIFRSLSCISSLKKLYINNNMITDEAADDIAAVLSKNTELEELDVSCNNLQATGIIKILKYVKCLISLTKLNIAHNVATDEAVEYIADCLSCNTRLKELNLSHMSLKTVTAFKNLKVANLKIFNFSGNGVDKRSPNELSSFLSHCISLQVLDLSCTNLQGADDIRVLQGLHPLNIRKLNISGNGLTKDAADTIAAYLSKSGELEELNLSYNNLQELGIKKILNTNISKLRYLNISNNHITSDLKYIANIVIHATDLLVLDLSYNILNANYMNRTKAYFINLIKLNISNTVIGDGATAEALADVLSQTSNLQELDVSQNDLHEEGIKKIFKELKISTLLKFNISHNNITDQAADYIATFLSRNTKLKELNVSYNNLLSAGAKKVCGTNLVKLTTFDIGYNGITYEATDDIATFLSHNFALQTLNLSYNILQELGCLTILTVLQSISGLSSLKLSNCNVNNEAADELATVLQYNTLLQELDLSCNNLSTPDVIKIFKGMMKISKLKIVDISHNMITDDAAESIATVLSHNINLQILNISFNYLKSPGFVTIFDGMKDILCLRKLDISHNQHCNVCCRTTSSIVDILSRCVKLEELNVSCNELQTADAVKILQGIEHTLTLTKLNIANNMINNGATEYIVNVLFNNSGLKEVNLCNNELLEKDVIAKIISKSANLNKMINKQVAKKLSVIITNLQELDLSDVNLWTSAFINVIKRIGNISTLRKINFSRNSITPLAADDLAEFISKNNQLEVLDLSHNSLQDAGVIKICKINISNLISFIISNNGITIEAADDVAKFLSYNSQLQMFDVSCNGLLEVGVRNILKNMEITQSIFHLSGLDVSSCDVINDYIYELQDILLYNTKLLEIDLSHNDLLTLNAVKIFVGMENISNLIAIDISHNMITDEAADEFATLMVRNISLQVLNFSCNKLSTCGAVKIFRGMKNISKLSVLNISHNMISDEAADELATVLSHNKYLQFFDASSNYFCSEGCIKVMNGLNNNLHLKKIDISYNKIDHKAADSIATLLSHNSDLKHLILSFNNFYKAGLLQGIKIKKLTKLDIGNNNLSHYAADDIAALLMCNTKLRDINMSGNKFLSDGITTIFHGMTKITNLERVNISHNGITDEAADVIANVLSENIRLQELYLNNNYLQSSGVNVLLSRMNNVSIMTHLDLSSNNITDEAAKNIANFLDHNDSLKVLDLSCNYIKTTGVKIIFRMMKTKFSLKKLNLSKNALDDEAADVIATFFSKNPSLEEFNISNNCLQAVGAVTIFKAIQSCPSILKLNMSNNKITDEAGNEIALVLSTATTLKEVDLDNNLLSVEVSNFIKGLFIKLPHG